MCLARALPIFFTSCTVTSCHPPISSLKIGGKVVKDGGIIEAEVLAFFGALFNGHHNVDLVDTKVPFVPDNQHLGKLLEGLEKLNDADSDTLHEDIGWRNLMRWLRIVETTNHLV